MSVQKGHAAFHLVHDAHGESGTRAQRRNLLRESMRHLDEKDIVRQAARNPSIVAAETADNDGFVNDGQGGFREAKSVTEVIEFGDARVKRVRRKVKEDQMTVQRFVVHLPKSMCVEIADYYPRLNPDGSERLDPETGEPMSRSRWVPRDREEAMEYFREALGYLEQNVIPGGHDAVHGYATNFDESTPHIQLMADPFAPDPKAPASAPDALRTEYSQAYRAHRDVRFTEGPRKGRQIDGPTKLRGYQQGLREHMISLGFPVESELSERAGKTLPLEEFKAAKDAEATALAALTGARELEAENDDRAESLDAWAGDLTTQKRDLNRRRLDIEADARERIADAETEADALVDQTAERVAGTDFGAFAEVFAPGVVAAFKENMRARSPIADALARGPSQRQKTPAKVAPARQRYIDRQYGG